MECDTGEAGKFRRAPLRKSVYTSPMSKWWGITDNLESDTVLSRYPIWSYGEAEMAGEIEKEGLATSQKTQVV